ncbi:putative esteraselipase/thioesterase protein [Oceanicola granulosus HTCC2516]|uniref:Putative esteraselipase/thioesterase protein n=1 Tax=Oceanicola granulosus (strain ATCC BAA-861 / DSM 15982 / KCTC 12143 / HTCC2516) TaxID=314256 RepID=Q2CAG9_OCEGH|nr:alpha/beta hydrolase [Oceanicola granulosus]EAR49665.1 putative esteraselipase/thioesterase protein [Oceanicola granulosus HTCC2516]
MSYHAARTEGRPGAPLVLTFHGTGGDEHQFHRLAEQLVPGAHVVSPRGDVNEHGAARYFRRTGEGVYDMADLARATEAMAAFIADETARTGAAQVIGLGYSNGANILAAVSFARPELVDRLALLHPLISFAPEPAPGLAGRPVLITAGEADPICPAPLTRRLIDWYAAQGARVSEAWHSGGHELRQDELVALQEFVRTAPAR